MIATTYALSEIIWWLVIVALIGFAVGWLLRRWILDRQHGAELDALRTEQAEKRNALQEERDEWKDKATALASDLDLHRANLDRAKTSITESEGKIADLETAIEGHRKEMSKLESKVEDRESTIASLRTDIGREDTQVAELRKELDSANGTIGTLRKDADGYKSTIDALRTDLDNERRKQADLQSRLEITKAEAESARSSLESARLRTEDLEAQIPELETSASGTADLEVRIASLEAELNRVRSDRDGVVAKLADLESEHADCAARLAAAETASAPAPAGEQPDMDLAMAKVAEIAARTRGSGPRVDDDLKKIHGIGPKLEQLLKSMDITSFKQVANFSAEDIQYVTAALEAFPGRIERDDWVASAAGEHTRKYGESA